MASWSLPLKDIKETGKAYQLIANPTDAASAFVVQVQSRAPGAAEHPDGGFLVAFGSACTHMGCTLFGEDRDVVEHDPPSTGQAERLTCGPCPCHGTTFDLTRQGLVVLGPATQNLPQLDIRVEDNAGDRVVLAERWLQAGVDPARATVVDPRDDLWPLGGA